MFHRHYFIIRHAHTQLSPLQHATAHTRYQRASITLLYFAQCAIHPSSASSVVTPRLVSALQQMSLPTTLPTSARHRLSLCRASTQRTTMTWPRRVQSPPQVVLTTVRAPRTHPTTAMTTTTVMTPPMTTVMTITMMRAGRPRGKVSMAKLPTTLRLRAPVRQRSQHQQTVTVTRYPRHRQTCRRLSDCQDRSQRCSTTSRPSLLERIT